MADTIREKILDNILTTLSGITVLAGYVNNLTAAKFAQGGNDLSTVPAAIMSAGPEECEDRPGLITSCKLDVIIDVYTIAATDTDAALNSLLGDIKKAMMADYTRGGYAVATRIQNIIPFESIEGQPYCGLIINCEVEYRHQVTNPTAQ